MNPVTEQVAAEIRAERDSLTPTEMAFAVYSAKRMVRHGRARRESFRALCAKDEIDFAVASGDTDAEFEEHFKLAESVVAEYGHLYDDSGELLPTEPA